MTGIQLTLVLGIPPLLTLAVSLWFRHFLQSRAPLTVEWPADAYVQERRRWVQALNHRLARTRYRRAAH